MVRERNASYARPRTIPRISHTSHARQREREAEAPQERECRRVLPRRMRTR
jgi:hypothetical protein